jgi:hypothetical protein
MMTGSAPFCAFEMYFFHPIDEPEVAVDVSGLFASSPSSSPSASCPKAPPSAASSDESDGATLCRPIPTMSLPHDAKEAALSVVSSDEEEDEEEEDDNNTNDDEEDDWVSSAECDFDDRENRPNAGRWELTALSSKATTTTTKRTVSELMGGDDGDDDDNNNNSSPLRHKQQRREAIGDPRPHDDAQQRARVLLWKQSLKRSLFHPFAEKA